MCGLFGYSGSNPVDITKLRWLAVANESRGGHSTGIYVTKNNKEKTTELFKDTGSADMFILKNEFNHTVAGSSIIQGHTRHATVGSITKDNAHPFKYDFTGVDNGTLVVGAHNGFVLSEFPKGTPQHEQFGFDAPFTVDSMLLFAALAKTGDYNILPKIEGGIAISFQMPNKYKDILFLYQSSGRELNVGLAPEGIYYSSEAKPLRLIGCKGITVVPYNTLVLLQGGKVLDFIGMPKPEISIGFNTKRDTFETRLSWDEKKKLGVDTAGGAQCSIYGAYGSPYRYHETAKDIKNGVAGSIAQQNTKSTTKSKEEDKIARANQDALGLLIKDVKETVDSLIDDPVQFSHTASYHNDSTDSCLMAISIESSTKGQPLPGWAIYSEDNDKIAGVTALNGVTVLQFPKAECGKTHKLMMTPPIGFEVPPLFSLDVNPLGERVMEVALKLPFPQKDTKPTTRCSAKECENGNKTILGLGESQLSLYADKVNGIGGLIRPSGNVSQPLQGQSSQIQSRTQEKQIPGSTGETEDKTDSSENDKGIYPHEYMGAEHFPGSGDNPVNKIPLLNLANMKSVIEAENRTFAYKKQVQKVLQSQEYSHSISIWRENFDKVFDLRRLFSDAAVLKINDLTNWNNCFSLQLYAWRLCCYCFDDYRMQQFGAEELKNIHRKLGTLIRNTKKDMVTEPDLKKKIGHAWN